MDQEISHMHQSIPIPPYHLTSLYLLRFIPLAQIQSPLLHPKSCLQYKMNKNKSSKQQPERPPSFYKFYLGSRERYIHINCDFESGNIQLVRQMSQFHYRLSCIDDGIKTSHRVNSKSWFYFSVEGFPKNTKGKFAIAKVQTLMAVYSQCPKSYRPVFRQCFKTSENTYGNWSEWGRITTQSPLILRENGELECIFDFLFKNQTHKVEFAFAYPYTYQDNISFLNSLNEYYCTEEFYFYKEILVKSPENRDIHLLTITSHDQLDKEKQEEEVFNEGLFPQKCRPKRFKKPVILITARVHPGETAASYTMEGIINFLKDNKDVRSFLLKKMFVFMLVPMINVDGVYYGNFRMDGFGKNLNRYYMDPDLTNQPAVYGIKELAKHLAKDNRLSFYFDLHAHNAKKGAFIYGNAINDFVEQVESQVFCKLFAMNNSGFQYEYCNFSLKQMNSKDRYQQRTKQGCGRVVMHRMANIIHSYSLQCGIISPTKHNTIPPLLNPDFKIQDRGLIDSDNKNNPTYFNQDSYRELGKSMLVSVLDVFDKNPYSRVYNSTFKSLEFLRRVTAFEVFHTAERFRMFQKYVYGKVRNINELIREVLNSKLHYKQLYNFYFINDGQLKNIQWPQNLPGLIKPKLHHRGKRLKHAHQPKAIDYSQQFINDLRANRNQLQNQGQPPQQFINPEQPIQQTQSYSSQTDYQQQLRQIDEKYFSNAVTSIKQIKCQDEYQKDESISSWRPQISHDFQEVSPQKNYSQDFSPQRRLSSGDNQSETFIQLQSLRDNEGKFKNLDEIRQISKLLINEKDYNFDSNGMKITQNDSPSVRVRRLLKQDNLTKKPKLSYEQMKGKLSQMICNPTNLAHSGAFHSNASTISNVTVSSFINKSEKSEQGPNADRQIKMFEEIKLEIKQQLRRHKEKKDLACQNMKAKYKPIKSNLFEAKQRQKERIKSTNINMLNLNTQINLVHHKHRSQTLKRTPSKGSITKTQLPALNSHILIITSNSSKGLTPNQ